MNVFQRYSPAIQKYIYQEGWESLRAIQAAAGDAIFDTDANVLLSASTASGKTEAAFFPIITLMQENPPASIGCLYIAPLKALINDQFTRLNDICAESGIDVWHWHGDVSAAQKKKLLKHPSGILQITPESLEAMLLRKRALIPMLFGDLRFIVIDEIHSFIRGDRGGQTFCLIERLCRLAGANPRRIGLSATIGEPMTVARLLSGSTGRRTVVPRIKAPGAKWRISMEHFYTGPTTGETEKTEAVETKMNEAADPSFMYLLDNTRGHKCLIFTNSREECETVCATLRQYCEVLHEPDRFLIHHGNLSVSYRQSAEETIKKEDSYMTVCTTSTLELGIDIGRLERAFQIDAPFTVSSFLQRMGRTGRRGNPSEMWFVIREDPAESRAILPARIPWKLLQAIALVQLYTEEKWVEPPREGRLPYSLLFHQTMSTLASEGEMSPAMLASRILSLSCFRNISKDDFRTLLRHLLETDQMEITENGGLIVGIAGEKVVNNFKFYAVFQENEEYSVRCESKEIGTIVKPPPTGDKIAIAGRVWIVEDIDIKRHVVYCHPVKGIIPAYFGDEPGDIHTHILQRMKRVLSEESIYPYLLPHARSRLAQARTSAVQSHLVECSLLPLGGNMYCLIPWLGSYSFLALERFIRIKCAKRLGLKGFDSQRPYFMQFSMDVPPEEFGRVLEEEAYRFTDPMELLYPAETPVFDKYDEFLPPELTRKGFAFGVLDVKEMLSYLKGAFSRTSSGLLTEGQ